MAGCGTKRMSKGGMAMAAGKGYKAGGMPKAKKTMRNLDDEIYRIDTEKAMEKRKMNKMSAGGKVRGCGIARKGLTKGTMR